MSLLQNATNFASTDPYFLLANQSTIKFQQIQANLVSTGTLQAGVATADLVDATAISTQFINCTSSLSTFELQADTAYVSSIYNSGINLDGQELTANAQDLLLNGVPIATTANLSSIQDWAFFPAVSTINLQYNSLVSVNQIRASNIFCANLVASNSIVDQFTSTLYISSQVIEVSSLIAAESMFLDYLSGPRANISSIISNNISTGFTYFNLGNANTLNVNTLSTGALVIGSEAAASISTGTLRFGNATGIALSTTSLSTGTASFGAITVSSITGGGGGGGSGFGSQWSQFPATTNVNMNGFGITSPSTLNVTVPNGNLINNFDINMTAGDVNIVADNGQRLDLFTDINLTAQNGNRGRINLTANPGQQGVFGEVNIVANGGTVPGTGVGTGGLITLTANTPISTLSNATSAIKFSAAGINSYAGAIPSIGSLAGYNFIYGNAGVNICAGLPSVIPNFPLTTYIYGTNGVSLDGINTVEVKASLGFESGNNNYFNAIYPFWGGLANPPDMLIAGRYIVPNLHQVYVNLSNVKQISMDSSAIISNLSQLNFGSSNGRIINVSSIIGTTNSGASFGTISAGSGSLATLFVLNQISSAVNFGQITGFSNIQANNITTTNINGIPVAQYLNTSTFQTASISSATISSINGTPVTAFFNTNIFSTASISTASISTLNSIQSSLNVVSSDPAVNPIIQVQQLYGLSTIGQFLIDGNNVEINATEPSLGYAGSGNLFLNADKIGINMPSGSIPGNIYCDISGATQIEYGSLTIGTSNLVPNTIITSNSVDSELLYCSTLNVSSIVSNQNGIYLKQVRQPLIQRGFISTTGGTGSATASWVVPYTTSSYNTFVTMLDNTPAQLSATNDTLNDITIYWANAGGGNHVISWMVMGDITP